MPTPHSSVMPTEVLQLLKPQDNSRYIDATFGAGGHTRLILDSCSSSKVIAVDRDTNVSVFAHEIKQQYGERFAFINSKFSSIPNIIRNQKIDGILFDVGVSSMQIDSAQRGFSFMKDGPLAMTMGQNKISAYDIVNDFKEDELARIILEYGEEKAATRIAKEICEKRRIRPIATTLELAEIVRSVVRQSGKIHPATLTFQALRIFVNDELKELALGLEGALRNLAVGAKVVVITFQGLEDKIVKDIFRSYTHKPHINKYKSEATSRGFISLTKNALRPSRQEIKSNPRARSAKMRAVELVQHNQPAM